MHIASEMFKWGCINAKKGILDEYFKKLKEDFEEIKKSAIDELSKITEHYSDVYLEINKNTNNFTLETVLEFLL